MRNITGIILIIAFLTAPAFVGAATQEEIIANIQQQIAVLFQKVLEIQAKLLALITQQTQEQIAGMEAAEPGILEELEETEPTLPQLEGDEILEIEESLSEEALKLKARKEQCIREGKVWYVSILPSQTGCYDKDNYCFYCGTPVKKRGNQKCGIMICP